MATLEEITLPDGSTRKLGNISKEFHPSNTVKLFGTTAEEELFDRGDWKKLTDLFEPGPGNPFLQYVHDQNGIGQCNPEAATSAFEAKRAEQGLEFIKLSAGDLYDRINFGGDNGSLLEDALEKLRLEGVGTAATYGGTLWKRGRAVPAGERARFKALEWKLCPTFAHVFSAALRGFQIVSGIPWYNNYTPSSDGWMPTGRGGSGGHAIHGYKPVYDANRGFGIWHKNSWSPTWGVQGRMILHEGCYEGNIGGWWALTSVVDEGGTVPQPK